MPKTLSSKLRSNPQFETERFLLRPFKRSDFKEWRDAHLRMLPTRNKFDFNVKTGAQLRKSVFDAMVARHQRFIKIDDIYFFGVFDKRTGAHVGKTSIELVKRYASQSATLAYSTYNNYWRQGYATETVRATVDFAFKKLKLHRLEAPIMPGNKPSIEFAKKIGMRFECVRRGALYLDGRWQNVIIYSMTAEDWGLRRVVPVYGF